MSVIQFRQIRQPARGTCIHLRRISRLIKATDGSGDAYNDTYYECGHLKKRITKRYCRTCVFFKDIRYDTTGNVNA